MKFFKELLEVIRSIPFGGIVKNVLTGKLGWATALAFVLQVVVQSFCATVLGFGAFGTVIFAVIFSGTQLLIGFVVGMLALDGMSGSPMFTTPEQFLKFALQLAIALSAGFAGGWAVICAVLGVAGSALLIALLVSVVAGVAIHAFGVILPIYSQLKKA